ncbi:MAG: polysaccharide biosynthesis/export family protein [Deltaproteobacteria bacterium]|nr:polysaccharide biosynthesis/export family protein [Deltaproteobacteria bacterium]
MAVRFSVLGLFGLLSAGCASTPVVQVRSLPSAVVEKSKANLEPAVLAELAAADTSKQAYQIGPGDSLLIVVYRHPELSLATYGGATGASGGGVSVDNDGTIQFPMIGKLNVDGKTTDDVALQIQTKLTAFIVDPQVTVQVQSYGSLRYYLVGALGSGVRTSDRPLRLMQLIALAGGTPGNASLRRAYLSRNGHKLPIDFEALLRHGDLRYDIPIERNDLIFVPGTEDERVFVIGQSGHSTIPIIAGQLSLIQALASVTTETEKYTGAEFDEIRVIRTWADKGEFYIVDAEAMLRGEAAPFMLEPGDVIVVPATPLADWNAAISYILPSLNAIGALLNPFFQIRVLADVLSK